MADIQADIDKLNKFASDISNLAQELSGIVPQELSAGSPNLEVGQHVVNFRDAVQLFGYYDAARRDLLGDAKPTPGSFGDLVSQLNLLGTVAGQIATNYQNASNEDAYSASMVDAALNPPASGSTSGG